MNRLHIAAAVIIGLSVIAWLFYKDFDPTAFRCLTPSPRMAAGIAMAVAAFCLQNFGLTWRYRLLTQGALTWRQALRVDLLCEFTSAVTPSAVGGSSLIFVYLYKEGMNAGKSTAVMIASLFLDEFFLTLSCVAVVLLLPVDTLFAEAGLVGGSVKWLFFLVLAAIAAWTAVLYVALFHKPQWVKGMLLGIFSLPLLRRWKENIRKVTDELVTGSREIRSEGWRYLVRPFAATALSWCSRYAIVNALLFAFGSGQGDQLLAYARQWVLWMIAIISPTPGGSGLNEYMFKTYYTDFFPTVGVTVVVALVWRLITYYSYLIAGTILIPGWLKGTGKK